MIETGIGVGIFYDKILPAGNSPDQTTAGIYADDGATYIVADGTAIFLLQA
jgi:hypothetical protein